MNLRNSYAVVAVRTMLGAIFLFGGVLGLFAGSTTSVSFIGVPTALVTASAQLAAMGLLKIVYVAEVVAGIMLITGFLPALAVVIITPICIGILFLNANIAKEYEITGILVALATIYLGYVYWDKYKALFKR